MFKTYNNPLSVYVLAGLGILVGVSGSLLSTFVSNPYPEVLGPSILAGSLGALLLYDQRTSISRIQIPSELFLGLYLIVFGATVLLFVDAGYTRLFRVHIALVGLFVLSFASVFILESSAVQLSMLLSTAVLHRAMVYYASALQIGNDAVFHIRIVEQITKTGTLEPLATAGSKYWYMPLYHLLAANLSSVSQISGRTAGFIAITVPLVIVPALVIYSLLATSGFSEIAVLGSGLYLVADRAIGTSVHIIPTSVGILLAAVGFLTAIRYLNRDDSRYLGAFFVLLLGHILNHPLGLLITTIMIGGYILGHVLWERSLGVREIVLTGSLVVGNVIQTKIARYPNSERDESIFEIMVTNLQDSLSGSSSGGASTNLPATTDFVIGSTDTLSHLQVLGTGILYGLAVLGVTIWITSTRGYERRVGFGFGVAVAVMSTTIFLPPILGIGVLLPNRWFGYVYLLLAMIAAPGIATAVSKVGQKQMAVAFIVLLAIVTPYSMAMMWNKSGSLDDPVFDDSPTAQRYSTTPTEAASYRFATNYGDGTTVVADDLAANFIERGFGYPTRQFTVRHVGNWSLDSDRQLVIDRRYAHTPQASYRVYLGNRWTRVHGPVPPSRKTLARNHSVVYTAGSERVVYKHADRPLDTE